MQSLEPYQNPFSVLEDYINLSDDSEVDFKSIKKQLFLELQLTDDQFINIKGKPYSKHKITELFDELETENYAFHLFIWKDNPLRIFLEKGEITSGFTIDKYSSYFNSEFSELELRLADSINKYSRIQIRNHKFKILADLISVSRFVNFDSKMLAFKRTIDLFNNFINHSNEYSGLQMKSKAHQFQYLKIPSINKLANALPEEYSEIRENYADAIVNFSYSFQHTDARFCRSILEYAQYLNCNDKTKKLLLNNYTSFLNTPSSSADEKKKIIKANYLIFSLILISLVVTSLVKTKSNKSNKKTQPTISEPVRPDSLNTIYD